MRPRSKPARSLSILPALLARAKVSVCTTVGLAPSADAYDHRALPCPAPCRARVAPAPQRPRRAIALLGTPAPSNFAGRARVRANPVAARRRSISRDSSRATRPPAFLRRFHLEELQDTEPESLKINAAPSARRFTTCRRIAGGVRRTGYRRPSVRGAVSAADRGAISARVLLESYPSPALFAQPPRENNTTVPTHTPLRTHDTRQPHTSQWTRLGARMRARRSNLRSTSSPTSSQPRDTNPPSTGVPPSPAGRHACGAASVGPAAARARPVRMLQAHAHEAACARCPLPRLPDSVDSAPAEARCNLRWPSARVRTRRLACFADGLRVASPVQAAAAASGRARRPPRPRHLRHDR